MKRIVIKNEDVPEAVMPADTFTKKKPGNNVRPESPKHETLEADPGLGSRVITLQVIHREDAHPQLKVIC